MAMVAAVAEAGLPVMLGPATSGPPESAVKTPLVLVETPREGATVAPGQVMKVRLVKSPAVSAVREVEIFSLGDPAIVPVEKLPATVSIAIPLEHAGDFELMVLALDGTGALGRPAERTIHVVPKGRLLKLDVEPKHVVLAQRGGEADLRVQGTFDDGVDRDLTAASAGTTYRSNGPIVAGVSRTGRVRAGFDGTTTVMVANGGVFAIVTVEVDSSQAPRCGNGLLDDGEECDPLRDRSGCCRSTCTRADDGTACTDPSDAAAPRQCKAGACGPP